MPGLLHSAAFARAIQGDPIVLVDAGARGHLDPPWAGLGPETLTVVGFEPDAEECRRLEAQAPPGRRYLPVALWSHETTVDIHVAATATCSSVHPPNADLLARYAERHVRPRDTVATHAFRARPLDAVLAEAQLTANVLKVDVQGAECEILQGAATALRDAIDVAVVETWTTEVHRGQGRTQDVLALLAVAGLSLFDVGTAAAWDRRSSQGRDLAGKPQIVGLDLLFIRDPADSPDTANGARRIKTAAVAEAYGFPDVALELVADRADLGAEILAAAQARRAQRHSRLGQLRRRLLRQAPEPEFATLHG